MEKNKTKAKKKQSGRNIFRWFLGELRSPSTFEVLLQIASGDIIRWKYRRDLRKIEELQLRFEGLQRSYNQASGKVQMMDAAPKAQHLP